MILDTIYNENCLETLKRMPDNYLHCCITSPPYFGLRDYGDPEQIGLEETPEAFVQKLVEVFREVKRALRPDGTLWLNLGDSYASNTGSSGASLKSTLATKPTALKTKAQRELGSWKRGMGECKQKDLIGIPWMVAFALRTDGWYLRQDIIWHKPNPMPESVTDRCTKAHEYIFLLSKSDRYYYDAEAIAEKFADERMGASGAKNLAYSEGSGRGDTLGNSQKAGLGISPQKDKRNKRSVWTVATKPYSEAHFATFPESLIEPCVLAGCPEGGIIYDPFMGAGTTALVALRANRHYIGSELNPQYVKIAEKRLRAHKNQLKLFV